MHALFNSYKSVVLKLIALANMLSKLLFPMSRVSRKTLSITVPNFSEDVITLFGKS